MTLEAVGALVSVGRLALEAYSTISGLTTSRRATDALVSRLDELGKQVQRLSDDILYAPDLSVVTDTTMNAQRRVEKLADVRQVLEPWQLAVGAPIASSALIEMPERMGKAMMTDPWEVLHEIRLS